MMSGAIGHRFDENGNVLCSQLASFLCDEVHRERVVAIDAKGHKLVVMSAAILAHNVLRYTL